MNVCEVMRSFRHLDQRSEKKKNELHRFIFSATKFEREINSKLTQECMRCIESSKCGSISSQLLMGNRIARSYSLWFGIRPEVDSRFNVYMQIRRVKIPPELRRTDKKSQEIFIASPFNHMWCVHTSLSLSLPAVPLSRSLCIERAAPSQRRLANIILSIIRSQFSFQPRQRRPTRKISLKKLNAFEFDRTELIHWRSPCIRSTRLVCAARSHYYVYSIASDVGAHRTLVAFLS